MTAVAQTMQIEDILRDIGPSLLKSRYRKQWSTARPTTGYCYVVSEAIYHFLGGESYSINLGELGSHWFIKRDGQIIDPTASQFDFVIDYSKARRMAFLKGSIETNRGFISKRGYEMAKFLGVA